MRRKRTKVRWKRAERRKQSPQQNWLFAERFGGVCFQYTTNVPDDAIITAVKEPYAVFGRNREKSAGKRALDIENHCHLA